MSEDVASRYETYVKQGLNPKDAAKKAQQETGYSLVTGKPFKQSKLNFTSRGVNYGGQFLGLYRQRHGS